MVEDHSEIEVCGDCAFYIENEELPVDVSEVRGLLITEAASKLPGHAVVRDEAQTFGSGQCGCCRTLHWGARYAVTVYAFKASRNAFKDEEEED